jgi:hypothetical protein
MNETSALQGYEVPIKKKGILANWALACTSDCLFMKAWAEELHKCACMGRASYRRTLPPYAFPGKGAIRFGTSYFTAHQAALKILHEHADFPLKMRSSRLAGEPFDHSVESLLTCIADIMAGRVPDVSHAFLKITGGRRRKIMTMLGLHRLSENS